MRIRSLALSTPGRTMTAWSLATFIIATFFTGATATYLGQGAKEHSFLHVRKSTGISNGTSNSTESNSIGNSSTVSRATDSALSVIQPQTVGFLPRDTCLFYSLGMHQEATAYARKKNLTTIWDVYPNHTFPQVQNYTNAERRTFYGILDREFARRCVGKTWAIPGWYCSDSFMAQEETSARDNKETYISNTFSIPGPYNGSYFTPSHSKPVALSLKCSDPSRFSGPDPHNYWGN